MSRKKQMGKAVALIIGAAVMIILVFCGWVYLTESTLERSERDWVRSESAPERQDEQPGTRPSVTEESTAGTEQPETAYPCTARLYEDHIGIFDARDQLIYEIQVRQELLTPEDRRQLEQGIQIPDEQEYIRLLESFEE